MNAQHTSGAWKLTIRPANLPDRDDITVAEIEVDGPYRGAITRLQSAEHIGGIGSEELRANAHLIAAAPDMLRVLEALEYWFDTDAEYLDALPVDERIDHNRLLIRIRATIAKARGQA